MHAGSESRSCGLQEGSASVLIPYSMAICTAGQVIQGSGDSRTKTLPGSGTKQLMQAGDGT